MCCKFLDGLDVVVGSEESGVDVRDGIGVLDGVDWWRLAVGRIDD